MKKIFLKKAFTIAEITMALLVVTFIAMLMLPSLFNHSEKEIIQTGLAKAYSQLQELTGSVALLESRGTVIDKTNLSYAMLHDVMPRTAKVVEFDANHTLANYVGSYSPVLATGQIAAASQVSILTKASASRAARGDVIFFKSGVALFYIDNDEIAVDVNGKKPPNKTGRDIFYFTFARDVNTGVITVQPTNNVNCNLSNNAQTVGCAYRIIYHDKGKITYY